MEKQPAGGTQGPITGCDADPPRSCQPTKAYRYPKTSGSVSGLFVQPEMSDVGVQAYVMPSKVAPPWKWQGPCPDSTQMERSISGDRACKPALSRPRHLTNPRTHGADHDHPQVVPVLSKSGIRATPDHQNALSDWKHALRAHLLLKPTGAKPRRTETSEILSDSEIFSLMGSWPTNPPRVQFELSQ